MFNSLRNLAEESYTYEPNQNLNSVYDLSFTTSVPVPAVTLDFERPGFNAEDEFRELEDEAITSSKKTKTMKHKKTTKKTKKTSVARAVKGMRRELNDLD